MTVLVTGAAGFIGSHVCHALLARGDRVVAVDNLNDYYSVDLKRARLARLDGHESFRFVHGDIATPGLVDAVVAEHGTQKVVHLAAQAGVRYSLTNPQAYVDSNIVGFVNVLEACRHRRVEHLVYASSSSVYGSNRAMPFSTSQSVDHPLSVYAATKRANELLAHSYSHLFGLPTTGLRFFTVYGPWGRPDMAMFLFTDAILAGRPIDLFNGGKMRRDFTYVDDIVDGIVRVLDHRPAADPAFDPDAIQPARGAAPFRVYNIGNNRSVELEHLVSVLEQALGRRAERNLLPMQPGDVPATWADVDDLMHDVGFRPSTPIEVGVPRFVQWYREYHGV